MKPIIAVYPGTFDPITFGHIDIIRRASTIFNHLIIAVAENTGKNPIFSLEERIAMVQREVGELSHSNKIEIIGFNGLLVNFVKTHHSNIILRGLRAVSDFEYEFQMASMNTRLNSNIQTIFLPASENTHFVSSKLVKEISRLGGNLKNIVSPEVEKALKLKLKG